MLDDGEIDAHLRGNNNFVAGVYPLLLDETCHFLAIDFDDEEWQKDISVHVEILAENLRKIIPHVLILTGGMGTKETRETMKLIADTPLKQPLTLVATGKYIGEGFDEPRLDTLFLAMPISWKGTLQQYAGRLHRLFENKNEVQIYDYIDIHVKMLEKMYHKRLAGYASIGYKAKGEGIAAENIDIIFDKHSFLPVYSNDILNASREILIVSPYVTKNRTLQMIQLFKEPHRQWGQNCCSDKAS